MCAFFSGPSVVRDGLILLLDAGNSKSYLETDGTNLVTNGTFDSNSDWTLVSATITGSKLVCNKTDGYADMAQQPNVFNPTPIGRRYRITYTISNYSTGSVAINYGGYTVTTTRSNNGTYVEDIILANPSSNDAIYVSTYPSPYSFVGDIDNIIVEEISENWQDQSGFGNHGTLVNGPTYDSGNMGSIVFDSGILNYVNCGNILNFERGDSFSICMWIKAPVPNVYFPIINKLGWAVGYAGWRILSGNNTHSATVTIADSHTVNEIDLTINNVFDNTWHYLCFTYDGSGNATGMAAYLDGVYKATGTGGPLTATIVNTYDLTFAGGGGAGAYGTGNIANVMIYNRALSQSEITQNFNSIRSRYDI